MTDNPHDHEFEFQADWLILTIAIDILKSGKKSAIKHLLKSVKDKPLAKHFVQTADEYLDDSFGKNWKKESKETLYEFITKLTMALEVMNEYKCNGEEAFAILKKNSYENLSSGDI